MTLTLIFCTFICSGHKKFWLIPNICFNGFVFLSYFSDIAQDILFFLKTVMIPLCVILNNHALINATKSEVSLVPPGIDSTLFTYFISVKQCSTFCIQDQSLCSGLSTVITTIQISQTIRKDQGS